MRVQSLLPVEHRSPIFTLRRISEDGASTLEHAVDSNAHAFVSIPAFFFGSNNLPRRLRPIHVEVIVEALRVPLRTLLRRC